MKKIFSKSFAILLTLGVMFSIGLLVFSAYAETTSTEKPLIELCDINSKPFNPEEYAMDISNLEGVPSFDSENGWTGSYAKIDESTFAHYFWVREFSKGDTVYVTPSSESAYDFRLLGTESGESIGTLVDGKIVFEITKKGVYVLTMLSDSSELTVKSHFNNINEGNSDKSGVYYHSKYTYYILEDGTVEIKKHRAFSDTYVKIPETIYGRPVVGLLGVFTTTDNLTGVTIPDTVKYLKYDTFSGCSKLKSVDIPDSVEYIGSSVFRNCTALETLNIGKSVEYIDDNAFRDEKGLGLKEITVDPENQYFSSENGVLYNKDKTVLIKYPTSNERKVFEIPEGVETIGDDSFKNCKSIRKVILPTTTKTIENGAFTSATNLDEVVLNEGLTTVLGGFGGSGIRTIRFPESVTKVSGLASTKLRYIVVPEGVTKMPHLFDCKYLVSLYIPDSVLEFDHQDFDYTNVLTDIYYGGTKEEFENIIRCDCNPSSPELCRQPEKFATIHYNHTHTLDRYYVVKAATPDSKGVADHACVCGYSVREEYEYEPNSKIQGFCGHGLTWDFDFATGALKISGYGDVWDYWDITEFPWYGIKDLIKSVELPEGITSISGYAFENCSNLSELIIPKNLISIGEYAFSGCTGLVDLSLGKKLQTIGDYAFNDCTSIEKVDLHENITSIGENTFKGCSGMKKFYVGKNIKKFDLKILEDFIALEKLYIHPDCSGYIVDDSGGVIKRETIYDEKYYDSYCFNYYPPCAPDETYAVPESVCYIKSNTFNGNKNIKTLYLPKNLKRFFDSAFDGCTGITDVYYCGTEEEWNKIKIGANNDVLTSATIHFEHTHSFTETAEKAATCSRDGYVKNICGECGYAETEVIPETGHTPTEWVYYANKVYRKNCSVCGWIVEETTVSWQDLNFEYELELWRTQSERFSSTRVNDSAGNRFYVDFNYTSSDENVVTVEIDDYTGYVFFNAVGLGEATITVTIDGTDISRVIEVTVVPNGNYVDWYVDGEYIDCDFVLEGEPIPVYEPPVKEGYEFVGWTPEVPETMPYDFYDILEFHAVYNKVTKSENFDVSACYLPDAFDEEVSLDVAEIQGDREPGGVYMVDGEYYKQVGLYNIKPINENGNVIQPNDGYKVTIRLAIPEAYKNQNSFMIYHRFVDGGREQLSTSAGTLRIENGYLVFDVTQFSEFEIFVKTDKPAEPEIPVEKKEPSIRISALPVKTVYAFAEELDLTGISVVYTNADGEKKVITNTKHLSVSGYDSRKTGTQTVTVNYGNCSATFEVTVRYTFWQWIIRILTFGLFKF
ncbi:MAG: leucine-rich repeat protein [Clostridia bacterium]|nr:leucine-rich repeat protein [Clostridia bacterium]